MVQIQVHHATFLSSPILAVFPTVRSSFGPMLPLTHEHFFIHAAAEELRMVAHMIGDRPGRGKRRLKARGGIILQPYSLTVLQFLQLGYAKTKSPFIGSITIYILNRYI